jgi:hypothetical protein
MDWIKLDHHGNWWISLVTTVMKHRAYWDWQFHMRGSKYTRCNPVLMSLERQVTS